MLTSEYFCKAVYARIIRGGTESAYGIASPQTVVVVDHWPASAAAALPHAEVLDRFDDGSALVSLRRYQAFTDDARAVAQSGCQFREIAGNRGPIMLSVIVPAGETALDDRAFRTEPISTRPGHRRILFTTTVPQLSDVITSLEGTPVEWEHIYDY